MESQIRLDPGNAGGAQRKERCEEEAREKTGDREKRKVGESEGGGVAAA